MKELWNKFTAWFLKWPKGTSQERKQKANEEFFREDEEKSKSRVKPKKIKGLNPKKKRGNKK